MKLEWIIKEATVEFYSCTSLKYKASISKINYNNPKEYSVTPTIKTNERTVIGDTKFFKEEKDAREYVRRLMNQYNTIMNDYNARLF